MEALLEQRRSDMEIIVIQMCVRLFPDEGVAKAPSALARDTHRPQVLTSSTPTPATSIIYFPL